MAPEPGILIALPQRPFRLPRESGCGWSSPGSRRRPCSCQGEAHDTGLTNPVPHAEDVNGELVTSVELVAWCHLRIAGLDLAALVAAQLGGPPAVAALVRSSAKSSKLGAGAMSDRRHMSATNVRRARSLPIT